MRGDRRALRACDAVEQHGEDEERDGEVEAVPLPREGVRCERHARDRRGEQHEQAELDHARAAEIERTREDARDAAQRRRLAAEDVVRRQLPTVARQVEGGPERDDRRSERDAGAEQRADALLHLAVAPARRHGAPGPVAPLQSICAPSATISAAKTWRSARLSSRGSALAPASEPSRTPSTTGMARPGSTNPLRR